MISFRVYFYEREIRDAETEIKRANTELAINLNMTKEQEQYNKEMRYIAEKHLANMRLRLTKITGGLYNDI